MLSLPLVDENGKAIKCPSDWSEVTLERWTRFSDLMIQLEKGAEMMNFDKPLFEMGMNEIVSSYPSYVLKVVSFWSGLTDNEIAGIDYDNIVGCYSLIFSLLTVPERNEEQKDGFSFKGTYYKAPKTTKDIHGNLIPMGGKTFIEAAEYLALGQLAQQVSKNKFSQIAKQIAIMYRPEGEEYNEEIAAERAEEFKNLPMDIVWQISFFLTSLRRSVVLSSSKYLEQAQEEMETTVRQLGDYTTSSMQQSGESLSIWKRLKRLTFTR